MKIVFFLKYFLYFYRDPFCLCIETLMSVRLEELFADDDEAQLILMGEMDELTAEEIREIGEIDATTYASARRRMRRRIDKEFPDGWR